VPVALGKDLFALGKGFAECHTRQRTHGKIYVGKDSLPSAEKTLGKDSAKSRIEKIPKKNRKFFF
jgi:hypothetical protein